MNEDEEKKNGIPRICDHDHTIQEASIRKKYTIQQQTREMIIAHTTHAYHTHSVHSKLTIENGKLATVR